MTLPTAALMLLVVHHLPHRLFIGGPYPVPRTSSTSLTVDYSLGTEFSLVPALLVFASPFLLATTLVLLLH